MPPPSTSENLNLWYLYVVEVFPVSLHCVMSKLIVPVRKGTHKRCASRTRASFNEIFLKKAVHYEVRSLFLKNNGPVTRKKECEEKERNFYQSEKFLTNLWR